MCFEPVGSVALRNAPRFFLCERISTLCTDRHVSSSHRNLNSKLSLLGECSQTFVEQVNHENLPKFGNDVKASLLFSKLPTGMPNPKAMTASCYLGLAGKLEGSKVNVVVRPCFLPCAGTDTLVRIVSSSSVVFVFLAVLFSSFLRTFHCCAHGLVDMTVHPRRFDRSGSRHTLRRTATRICHSSCPRQT